jgi:hypothetical protein
MFKRQVIPLRYASGGGCLCLYGCSGADGGCCAADSKDRTFRQLWMSSVVNCITHHRVGMAEPPSRKNLLANAKRFRKSLGNRETKTSAGNLLPCSLCKGNEDLLVVVGFDAQTVVTYGKPQLGFWVFWTEM